MNIFAISRFRQMVPRVATCALALLLAACNDPEEYILWSPDGELGLVRHAEKTAVINAAGSIIAEPFAGSSAEDSIQAQAWMPDSRRVLALRAVKARSWDEYAPLLGPERAAAVIRAAYELLALIRTYQGDWSQFGANDPKIEEWTKRLDFAAQYSATQTFSVADPSPWNMPIKYLSDRHAEEIAPLIEATSTGKDEFQPPIQRLVIRGILPGDEPREQTLVQTADAISWAGPSPDGRSVAFVCNEPVRPALYVVAVDAESDPVRVDAGVTQAAWSRDGKTLFYQKTTVPFATLGEQAQLGTLTRRHVCDDSGVLLASPPDPEDLAGILFSNAQNRVACLPDGRVLFASCEVSLPATETARDITLFALRPGAPSAIERVVASAAQSKMPSRVDRFSVSPDGRFVALPGENGALAVLSLETGDVMPVQGAIANHKETDKYENSFVVPAPVWRKSNELCYAVGAGEIVAGSRRAEVVLRPIGGTPRAISQTWPDALTDAFLPRPKR
jgi:hypothetical protein